MNELTNAPKPDYMTPPADGEPKEKVRGDFRYGWDAEDGVWRLLSKHCPLNINPFDNYKPVEPFKTIKHITSSGFARKVLVDANGIRLTKAGKIKRSCYPMNFEKVAKTLWKPSECPIKSGTVSRFQRVAKFLQEVTKNEPSMAQFLDDYGNPKPEMILGFYVALWRLIFARPEVQGSFLAQVYEQAVNDPISSLQEFQRMVGMPLQLFIGGNDGGTSFVKLNIFQGDGTLNVDAEAEVKAGTQTVMRPSRVVGEAGGGD